MLQRLLAVTALLASAASVSDAVQVHVRIHHTHHKSNHHQTKHARAVEVDAATTTTSSTAGSAAGGTATVGATDPNAWSFSQVKSIQARVQGNTPSWDAKTKTWVASFGKTYNDQFRSVLDTVNTASVEGALMYVQAEGINVNEQSVKCERKNKMQYVVFYEMDIVQPNASVAFYGGKDSTATLEYCPYVAMDGGKCTPAGEDFPDACKQFDGIGGQPKLGHCVGAGEQTSDKRAPYPGNYWFSYPTSCVTKGWSDKTDACRTEFAGGLCAPGVKPDGVTCSFTYKILGYLNIDDLVGITDGSAAEDGKKYKNYTEFCKAGNVEFAAKNTGSNGFEVETAIAFWEKPGDEAANEKRTQEMIDLYNELAPEFKNDAGAAMTALPEVDELAKTNPPCYKNNKDCAAASNGCRRVLYSQICEVCDKADADCVKAPSGFTFPTLQVPKPETAEGSQASSSSSLYGVGGSGSGKQNVDAGKTDKDNKPGAKSAATATTATAGVSLAMAVGALATAAAML